MGGASQPSTEPQIKRRGWGHRVAPHTLWPTRYNRNRLWLFYLGFFVCFLQMEKPHQSGVLFSHSTACVINAPCVFTCCSHHCHLGWDFFFFLKHHSAQTGMETRRFDCRPSPRRVAVGFVLVGTKKLRSNAGKK